jgi:hypothetical protein
MPFYYLLSEAWNMHHDSVLGHKTHFSNLKNENHIKCIIRPEVIKLEINNRKKAGKSSVF